MDLVSSNLRHAGLNFVTASMAQMIRGGTIITTLLFSMILMKKRAERFEKVGCIFAVMGLILIGFSAMISQQDRSPAAVNEVDIFRFSTKSQAIFFL